jgi:hypothetical protein
MILQRPGWFVAEREFVLKGRASDVPQICGSPCAYVCFKPPHPVFFLFLLSVPREIV